MSPRATQSKQYWVEEFQVQQSDLDYLYSVLLEQETPLTADEMALVLMRHRVEQESQAPARRGGSDQYQPTGTYQVGDELSFPSVGYARGKVIEIRPGDNPYYGSYMVLRVSFASGKVLEFASGLAPEHVEWTEQLVEEEESTYLSPEELFIEYGGEVADAIERELEQHDDLVRLAGRWFPRSLLANINSGHLNLAEAILDMHGGGPMTTREIMEQVGMLGGVNERLAEFSLNYGMQGDSRFDEVGPAGQVLWFLARMEPEGVQHPPVRLAYEPIPSDPELLTSDLRLLEAEIGDEHSNLPAARTGQPQAVTVTLIYPHRRSGTLPLSPLLRSMFPTAYQSPRVRFTIVDAEGGQEYPAWVVRPEGYVYGLGDLFDRYDVPVGSYVTIQRTPDPGRVLINLHLHKPRKEWVRSARVENNRLRFENVQRPVGTDYDDLMVIDVPDPDAIDMLWRRLSERGIPLEQIMVDVMRELSASSPQGHVHAKTLYSAINLIRRSPPGPIFARLVALPQFGHVGGAYWRLSDREAVP